MAESHRMKKHWTHLPDDGLHAVRGTLEEVRRDIEFVEAIDAFGRTVEHKGYELPGLVELRGRVVARINMLVKAAGRKADNPSITQSTGVAE